MNPMSLADVRKFWLPEARHPSKRLGQNFLVDANIARIMLDAAELTSADLVLEIGPGLGALTRALAERVACVAAVEIDRRLHAHLARELGDLTNLRLICADALKLDLNRIFDGQDFKLAANLPYASGSAILVNLLQAPHPPAAMAVTLQLEVGQRLAAFPGRADYGLLGLWASLHYETALVKIVSPSCFWPPPAVKSAIVRLRRLPSPAAALSDRAFFFALTKQAFGRRRKQLGAALRGLPVLRGLPAAGLAALPAAVGIDPHIRPESLGVAEWGRLANHAATLVRAAGAE